MSLEIENIPEYFDLATHHDGGRSYIIDDITGEAEFEIDDVLLDFFTDDEGVLNDRGLEYFGVVDSSIEKGGLDIMPEGAFYGGRQSVLSGLTFRGGSQIDETLGGTQVVDADIEKHELRFLEVVLSEIFDGRSDFGVVDTEFLLSPNTGMPQTLRSLFINKPGHNGGKSSLRHIFKGDHAGKDKGGGLHVPAFAPELKLWRELGIDPFTPFEAIVGVNGCKTRKIIQDGTPRIELAPKSMFPICLDSLAVLQCIIDAWEHKGDCTSSLVSRHGNVSSIYEVPVVVEGITKPMNIRLVTDSNTKEEKIRTAFPVIK